MPSDLEQLFPRDALDRVTDAVRLAEKNTSGEIVPYVVARSDRYPESIWRAAAIGTTISLLILGTLPLLTSLWLPFGVAMAAVIAIGAGILAGLVVALVPALQPLVAGKLAVRQRVAQRATAAFIAEEVFATRDRGGILIFISILERRVIVLGDSGINAVIAPEEWNGIVDRIIAGIRSRRGAEGLIEAIGECGRLLNERGFPLAPDDINELPDTLRFGGESGGSDALS
jgi:putative membrane protein